MKEMECRRKIGRGEGGNKQDTISDDPVANLSEVIHRKQDHSQTDDADVAMEPIVKDNRNEQEAISHDPVSVPHEVIHSKRDNFQSDNADMAMESFVKDKSYLVFSSDGKCRRVIRARDKFPCCNSCSKNIVGRILVCAGCRKVAYCHFECQKASWVVHKKVCSYALKKGGKESTD